MKSFRNFDGSLSQVCDNLDTAVFDIPITMAKNAFKFWNSLQLNGRQTEVNVMSNLSGSTVTHYAASLMNFFSNDTRLFEFDVDTISVTTQYWISLNLRMKTSRFDVILIKELNDGSDAMKRKKKNSINVKISLEVSPMKGGRRK